MDDDKQPLATTNKLGKPNIWQFFSACFANMFLRGKKRIIISLTILVLMVGATAGLVRQYQKYTARNRQLAAMSSFVEGIDTSQKAQYYSNQGEYAIAEKVWQDQLAKTSDTPTKLNIYFMQSSIAVKFKNYKDAKKYADEALKLAPKSSTPYVSLAYLAQAQGDITAAKTYWRQAIKNIDPKDPGANLIQIDYQISLDALK